MSKFPGFNLKGSYTLGPKFKVGDRVRIPMSHRTWVATVTSYTKLEDGTWLYDFVAVDHGFTGTCVEVAMTLVMPPCDLSSAEAMNEWFSTDWEGR